MNMQENVVKTILGPDCYVKGELHLNGPAAIAGRVEGYVEAADTLVIEQGAQVDADVQASVVEVLGTVKGNITATRSCKLGASARVSGELRAANLAISEGACFIGQVYVGGLAPAEEPVETGNDAQQEQIDEAAIRMRSRMEQLAVEEPVAGTIGNNAPVVTTAPAMVETVPAPAANGNVRVVTQTVQQTLQQRAPRVIKMR